MKVLLLTQVLPYPPDSGPKIKTLNVLKYLVQQHEVTLVSFVRGDQSAEARELEKYCHAVHTIPIARGLLRDAWYMLLSFLRNQPFMMVRDDRAAMRQLVDRLTAETRFDIAHADQLNMAQYAARLSQGRKILDAHNALWVLYKRLWQTMKPGLRKILLGRDWQMLKTYEGRICREFDAVLAVSDEDKVALAEAAGQPLKVTVIPIAVDTDDMTKIERSPDADHILHIGTMFWPPNVDGVLWFIHEVWPLVRDSMPDAEFDVVGANPPREIMAYDQKGEGVNVTGYVEDPTPYFRRAAVMVVPLRAGGGMRVKILNALAQGLPIVTTTIGCEGIAVEPGQHLLVADTAESFAQAVLMLINDRCLADELGRNGRELIRSVYDYRQACQPIARVYQGS
jgi:glycosyltransferase involved in cell wall biosynthesis